ncbi:MAG TPA: PAS domain S-box protein, partial [Pyrinomonadaceae bacterium]|nr:PAS domain S-box protein [Pyrinomonadaceae bacterium]
MTIPEMRQALAGLPPDTIVFFVSNIRDHAGNTYESPDYLRQVSAASAAPIYGTTDGQLGMGIVGGRLHSFEALGAEGGRVGLRLLAGERPEAVAPHGIPGTPMFDWRELRRWGISEQALPPGSVVKFREFSFWELYKWYIVGTVAACIIEALLIVYLLIVQRRQRLAERERERLTGMVEAEHRHLNETVSNVPGIVWETLIDPRTKTRRTIFISDYVEKMLGYTPAEWVSSPPGLGYRLMPEADREGAAQVSEEVTASGKEAVIQHRWRAKDGRTVWVESHMSPMLDEAGKVVGLRGVSIDITEMKLAEDARRQSEQRNLATLRAIPDLMFLQTREGVYLDYHAKDVKDLFVPPEQFIGKNVRDVMPPEPAEMFLERFSQVDESGDPQVVEYDLNIGGQQRWYEARLVRCGDDILSVVRDITERRRAEIALRDAVAASERNRAQLESVFQTVADGIIVTDMAGNVLLVNEANGRIHGYESHDEMKLSIAEFAPHYELIDSDGRLIPYEEWPLSKILR